MVALWLAAAGLVLVALAQGGDGASAARHAYLVPAAAAALASGRRAGVAAGVAAGLLQAPLVFPAIEREGVTAATVDGAVALGLPAALGLVLGHLREQAGRRGEHLRLLLELHRRLGGDGAVEPRLAAAVTTVRAVLRADEVALLVQGADGGPLIVAPDGVAPAPWSAARWGLDRGVAVVVSDLEADPRFEGPGAPGPWPRRGLVLPVAVGSGAALLIEWRGDPPSGGRRVAEEIVLHLALAVENARLTLQQRAAAAALEIRVAEATAHLSGLARARSELISVVSHELRTPLTALQGFSELLLTRAVPPERAQRFLEHIHGEAHRLGRLVADLLDLARLEAGQAPPLERQPVDLGDLVQRNLELFAAQHPGHRFLGLPSGPGPVVPADRDALDRVIKNLLANAVKYSPGGGQVAVTVGAAETPGLVELAVADEGVGIPADALSRIFEPWVRLPGAATARVQGLGLGLSLVRGLVEAHGGRVEAESEPGRGSRFRVVLPDA